MSKKANIQRMRLSKCKELTCWGKLSASMVDCVSWKSGKKSRIGMNRGKSNMCQKTKCNRTKCLCLSHKSFVSTQRICPPWVQHEPLLTWLQGRIDVIVCWFIEIGTWHDLERNHTRDHRPNKSHLILKKWIRSIIVLWHNHVMERLSYLRSSCFVFIKFEHRCSWYLINSTVIFRDHLQKMES